MLWLADECVDAGLVASLRATGHDVLYVAELAAAADDLSVLRLAQDHGRLLLTEDKDFGDLVFRREGRVPGIVLVRIEPHLHTLKIRRVQAAIGHYAATLFGRYTTVEAARLRSRPLLR